MIVVDASAAVSALLNAGPARDLLGIEPLHAPHLIDAEVANALRRRVAAGSVGAEQGLAALRAWQHLGLTRYPMVGLLDRIWQPRANMSAYDACYVGLAEAMSCGLLTADARLARAPGARCPVTVVQR